MSTPVTTALTLTPGTPIQWTVNKVAAKAILIIPVPGGTGSVFVGVAGLNKSTLANCVRQLNPPPTTGILDYFSQDLDGMETLYPSDYWVDGSAADKVLLTYWP